MAKTSVSYLEQVVTPCIDNHHHFSQQLDFKVGGELVFVCTQILLTCFILARFGRPDILWTINTLARAATWWNRACHQRLARLMIYLNFTKSCHVGGQVDPCKFGLFQDDLFAGDLQGSKSTSGGVLDILGVSNIRANFVDAHKSKQQPLTAAQRQI